MCRVECISFKKKKKLCWVHRIVAQQTWLVVWIMFIQKNDLIINLLLFWQMMNSKFDYLHKFFQEKKHSKLYPKSHLKNWSKSLIKKKKKV